MLLALRLGYLAPLDFEEVLLAAQVVIQQVLQLALQLVVLADQGIQSTGVMHHPHPHHLPWEQLLKLPFCDLHQTQQQTLQLSLPCF